MCRRRWPIERVGTTRLDARQRILADELVLGQIDLPAEAALERVVLHVHVLVVREDAWPNVVFKKNLDRPSPTPYLLRRHSCAGTPNDHLG